MSNKSIYIFLLLTACAPQRMRPITTPTGSICSVTCIDTGEAITAGHCVGKVDSYYYRVKAEWCDWAKVRIPTGAESVTVRGFVGGQYNERGSVVIKPDLSRWLLIDGPAQPGESGGGVYGFDGALLGIVIGDKDGYTLALKVVQEGYYDSYTLF